LMRLTGIDAQENQARRLLNDLDQYRADTEQQLEDEEFVAHEWLQQQYEPVVRAVPRTMRSKLEPPEFFHEILEHSWFLSEREGHDVSLDETVRYYILNVLIHRPDEKSLVTTETSALPIFDSCEAAASWEGAVNPGPLSPGPGPRGRPSSRRGRSQRPRRRSATRSARPSGSRPPGR